MSSRRSSRQLETGSELFLECKASFLSIFDDITDKIESKKKLSSVLQQSGRNPTTSALNKYWPKGTDELSFDDFVDICRKEPVTSADDLMKAFRKIDINGDGYISLDELYKIMNKQGENMSRDDVKKMIDEVDDNKDGRLDYSEISSCNHVIWRDRIYYDEFTNMIMKTTEESKKFSMKVMEKKERKKKRVERLRDEGESPNTSKQDNHSTKSSPRKDSPRVSPRSRTDSGSRLRSGSGSRARSDSDSKQGVKKGNTPRESARRDSGAKETPRRDSNARNEKPPLPDSPRSKDEKAKSLKQDKPSTPMEKDGNNSARSVGEEISYDDDFDIVSTGRPTPRINLNAKVEQTPRQEDKEEKKVVEKWETASKSGNETKGNSGHTSLASHALANCGKDKYNQEENAKVSSSFGKGNNKYGDEDKEKRDGSDTEKGGENARVRRRNSGSKESSRIIKKTGEIDDLLSLDGKSSGRIKDSTKSGTIIDDLFTMSSRSNKSGDGLQDTTSFVDEIFKSSRSTRSVLSRQYDLIYQETVEEDGKDKKDSDKNSKTAKEGKDEKKTVTAKLSGKDSVPVPSPRKSVSRLSEDDVPRPSPRVKRDGKTKSSSKHKEELPDIKSLRDWQHYTSKGCFFYEEDEIVTHVYSLRLKEDSSVYLSARPIEEPACLNLPGSEPVDTALFVFDSEGQLVTFTELRDTKGTYGVKCDLSAGTYQVLPYTTGCRFKQRPEDQHDTMKESKLVKTKDDKIAITSAFRKALEDIFELCDLDDNGTMSRDEFNWFNLRTSGEELGEDEWEVVEEKTALENGEITKQGFIELNEMEAEDAAGEVEDLWITLTSMGMNKGLIMDEACPYRVDVYVEELGRKKPSFKVTGIESLEKKEFASEICKYMMDKAGDQTKIRNMKDLYMYTYKNELRAAIIIDNKSRSSVSLQVDCRKSRNVVSNRPEMDYTFDIDPQSTAIAHHLLPKSEINDWSISCTETIH